MIVFYPCTSPGSHGPSHIGFNVIHPEDLPSAQKRHNDELKRVVGVLDCALAKPESGWLFGDKCTYVYLAFFIWDEDIETVMAPFEGVGDPAKFRESPPSQSLLLWAARHILGAFCGRYPRQRVLQINTNNNANIGTRTASGKKWHGCMAEREAV